MSHRRFNPFPGTPVPTHDTAPQIAARCRGNQPTTHIMRPFCAVATPIVVGALRHEQV